MDDDEEDDKANQPTKYEFSEESKLDEDHLFYLQFTNNFISNVSRPRDFDHCTRWLERLAGEPMYGVEAKRNRNMYLARLLIAMQDNKVVGPFASFPPAGPLPNAGVAFGLQNPEDEDSGDLLLDEIDKELNMQDYKYESKDGRTFIATCALPESSGVMAYVGLTFGGGEGLWLNKDGFQVRSPSQDRIPAVTPKTPVRKQVEMIEQHKELVRRGLDQVWQDLPDDAFQFLIDLPISSSDSNLLELGNYKFDKKTFDYLAEVYEPELVEKLQDLLVESKKEIEKRFRVRHTKIVKDLYKEYSAEIERGLREYKEARQEWATVYQVVAELKEVLDEKDSKENATHTEYAAAQGNRPTAVLVSSLNDAKERQKRQYDIGKELDEKKVELHKDIHERALFHMHELEKLEGHVDKLNGEICILRRDSKKKQMVIHSLNYQMQKGGD